MKKTMLWSKVVISLAIVTVFAFVFTTCKDDVEDLKCPPHTWGNDVVTAPTCADGYTTQTCSVCSETQQINPTAGTGQHTWGGDVVISPTCADGYTTQTCSICSGTRQINPTAGTGQHTWGSDVVTPPSCADGYTTQTCSDCSGTRQINPIPGNGQHNWGGNIVTPPSCIDGYTTQTCSICTETQKINPITRNGQHNWGNSIVVAPTCEEEGYTEQRCTLCYNDGKLEITIEMWDRNGDGWDESGELIIVVYRPDETGSYIPIYGDLDNAQIKPKAIGSNSKYHFNVRYYDYIEVWFYYITTFDHSEKAFSIYYSNDPPNPPFNPNSNYWSSADDPNGKVISYRQYDTIIDPYGYFNAIDCFEYFVVTDPSIQRSNIVSALGQHDWVWNTYVSGSGLRECQRSNCTVTARIGHIGPAGGVIFYSTEFDFFTGTTAGDTATEKRYYLEAAPSNIAGTRSWGITGLFISGLGGGGGDEVIDWEIGRGWLNTSILIASGSSPAAGACAALRTGDKDDWFLPSSFELNALAQIRGQHGIPNTGWFWSSSQRLPDTARSHDFGNDTMYSMPKATNLDVRAVRAF